MKTAIAAFLSAFLGGICLVCLVKRDQTETLKHYQLEIKGNTAKLYDQNRLIGTAPLNKIDSLIINDNQ